MFGEGGHGFDGFGAFHAAIGAGVDQHAFMADEGERWLGDGFFRVVGDGENDEADLEFIFFGEFVVALVVGGNAHDGAGAVIHEDVIRYPDGNFFAVERVDGVAAGGDAVLLDFSDVAGFFGFALLGDELIDFSAKIGIGGGEIIHHGMLGRELD